MIFFFYHFWPEITYLNLFISFYSLIKWFFNRLYCHYVIRRHVTAFYIYEDDSNIHDIFDQLNISNYNH